MLALQEHPANWALLELLSGRRRSHRSMLQPGVGCDQCGGVSPLRNRPFSLPITTEYDYSVKMNASASRMSNCWCDAALGVAPGCSTIAAAASNSSDCRRVGTGSGEGGGEEGLSCSAGSRLRADRR